MDSLPFLVQLACVQELLKAGGAMTEKQMHKVLDTIYHESYTQVCAHSIKPLHTLHRLPPNSTLCI